MHLFIYKERQRPFVSFEKKKREMREFIHRGEVGYL